MLLVLVSPNQPAPHFATKGVCGMRTSSAAARLKQLNYESGAPRHRQALENLETSFLQEGRQTGVEISAFLQGLCAFGGVVRFCLGDPSLNDTRKRHSKGSLNP